MAPSLSPHTKDRVQPPNAPRPQHASVFHPIKAIKPPPGFTSPILDAAVVESGLPNIQGLFISSPTDPHQSQAELVHRATPAPWSCIIYIVAPARASDEAWSEFDINWRRVAARLGARLELASHPAEKPSLFSDESIADKADSLLTLIKSHDNCCAKGCFGSRANIDIARNPLILAGYGIGGIIIKRMILSILQRTSETDLGILERILLLVFVETPHRTLDLEDWSRVTQGLFGEKKGTMDVEKASRIAECTPGIFQLACGIGRGIDIAPFISKAVRNPKRPDRKLLRFLQELLTHFDLNNVHWRPPRSAEGYAWLSTHPEYTAWTEHWTRDSAPSSALFLQYDCPKTRRNLTNLTHYLARETPTIRPRSIVAKFSFAEHMVKDKHVETVLAAFAFQILCLQPARFKAVRHMELWLVPLKTPPSLP
ncbi:hypothetical protein B0T18DRAFT_430754 [Schizothecium vesticola]|uniref:Uncharacterized protein n=1 Tax=Schizothecium vesticola TaxID=314040 RepID=A0AA40EQ92_9PEZI|nr:hypothetical protein B0T18DRAFT_430754 [Schizothecium vesticola]